MYVACIGASSEASEPDKSRLIVLGRFWAGVDVDREAIPHARRRGSATRYAGRRGSYGNAKEKTARLDREALLSYKCIQENT